MLKIEYKINVRNNFIAKGIKSKVIKYERIGFEDVKINLQGYPVHPLLKRLKEGDNSE
jgi:hypothetical protein